MRTCQVKFRTATPSVRSRSLRVLSMRLPYAVMPKTKHSHGSPETLHRRCLCNIALMSRLPSESFGAACSETLSAACLLGCRARTTPDHSKLPSVAAESLLPAPSYLPAETVAVTPDSTCTTASQSHAFSLQSRKACTPQAWTSGSP